MNEIEQSISDFNKTRTRRKYQILFEIETPEGRKRKNRIHFEIGCIFSRIEYFQNLGLHSRHEYVSYQNDLAKVLLLNKQSIDKVTVTYQIDLAKPLPLNEIEKIIFSSAIGGKVEVSSALLIHFLSSYSLTELDECHAQVSQGGTPSTSGDQLAFCYVQIQNLKKDKVPTEFIANLFGMDKDAFKKAIQRGRDKTTSK